MNWPAPDTLAPPPAPRPAPRPETPAAPPGAPPAGDEVSDVDRRRASAVPAAVWVALLGSALVIIAATAVVAGNWGAIGESFRVAGLAATAAGLVLASERLRRVVPSTAGVIAHVGTFLTAFVGIAVLSLFGLAWPACITVGGLALAAATGFQADRWRRATMHLGQIAGLALASAGVGALAGTSAGLVAAVASVGLLVSGADRRAAALALLAVASPALTALADAGIGDGTLARAGLVGERLSWSGPIVGLLAATVIGAVAHRRGNNPLMLVAAASPVVGIVTGLAAVDGSAVAWWSVPALVLVAAELGLWLLPADRSRELIAEVVTAVAGVVAGLSCLAPLFVRIASFDGELEAPWAIPVTLTAVALATSVQRWRSTDTEVADLGLAAIGSLGVALATALAAPAPVVAVVAVALVAAAAFMSRRLSPVAIHPVALWAIVSVVGVRHDLAGNVGTVVALGLLGTLLGIVLASRTRLAASLGAFGWPELVAVVAAGAAAAILSTPWPGPTVGLSAAVAIATAAAIIDRRLALWAAATTALAGIIALDAATASGLLQPTYTIGWMAATAAFTTVWLVHRTSIASYAAASSAVLAVAAMAPTVRVDARDFIIMAMLATVATTGVAFSLGRRSPLDAAALTAGGLLLTATTFDLEPAWVSAAWLVLGLQIAVAGVAIGQPLVRRCGLAAATVAVLSWWFTSGLHDRFLDLVEPAGITVADLWFAAISVAALVAGLTIRSTTDVNSWVAYTAALSIPTLWLSGVHLDRPSAWAIPLLLTIGVIAAGAGAWHRLAAPLVEGTGATGLAVFFATGSDLTSVPIWAWLGAGGCGLLVVATLIERTGRPGRADLRQLVAGWR